MKKNNFFNILIFCLPFFMLAQNKESFFEKANSLFKQEKWSQGKIFIDKGLEEAPLDSDLLMLNGKYYHINGDNNKARLNLMRSLQLDPINVDAKQILINVEMESKHYSAAICYVNELLEVNPYWKGLWRKKIDLYKLQGNNQEANRLLKRINQIYPEDTQLKEDYRFNLQNEIIELRKEGRYEEALLKVDELIKLDSKNPQLYSEAIATYLSVGDSEKALLYTNKALAVFPNNIFFIKKKASILSDLGDLTGAMNFLRSNINSNPEISQLYNEMVLENARNQSQNDPYALYGKVFEKNPSNREALTYLLNTSISRGYYSDAEYFLSKAKKSIGETKDLLYKEYLLYRQMGNKTKENQLLVKIHQQYPEDTDILEKYNQYQFEFAKQLTSDQQYIEALVPLNYLKNIPEFDLTENVLQLLVNVYLKLNRYEDAMSTANSLIKLFPDNINNHLKKAVVFQNTEKYEEALNIYEEIIEKADIDYKEIYINGYEEISLQYVKKLIEAGQNYKALEIINSTLKLNPKNELALKYAINNSFKIEDYDMALQFSKNANKEFPENLYFSAKLAESYNYLEDYDNADTIINPLLEKYSFNTDLINVKTETTLSRSKILVKEKKSNELLVLTNDALRHNKNNIELKYYKGLAFQMQKQYDSAYYYQKHYVPSNIEEEEFKNHMNWLKNKTYKNQFAFFYLRSKFSDQIDVSGISTIEYTRYQNIKNTFTGRLNYTGKDFGAGYLLQLEWYRVLNKKTYAMANVGYGTKYFPQLILNASIYRSVFKEMEVELGVGYRNLPKQFSLLNFIGGVSKKWENVWINSKLNVYLDNDVFYNVLLNSKFYVFGEGRSYIQAMTSVGSISEAGALDLSLYSKYNAFNTMVGLGGQHMISEKLSLGVLGNWYNFKETPDSYRNLFNFYFQVYYSL